MKTAVIVNPYWDSFGGGERYSATVAQVLLKNGWNVDVKWSTDISSILLSRFNLDLSRVNFVNDLNISKYDLVFWVSDGSLPTSFAKKTLIHFQFPFNKVGGKSILNLIKSRFYLFITNSKFTKSFIDTEFLVDSTVLYPPVETSSFTSGTKSNTFVYVGRFSPLTQLKNQHLLIQAFRDLQPQLSKWELVLAGGVGIGTTVDQMDDLRKQSEGLKIKIITNPSFLDLKTIYSKSKIFWSAAGLGASETAEPIKVEHFGITVVEAMAAGCIPILPRLGGHKEIVNDSQDGYLYDSLDQLKEITLNLVSDVKTQKQLSQAAINRSKIFDVEHFTKQFEKLI